MHQKRFNFTLTGLAPIIMHWDNIEWADQMEQERTRIKSEDVALFKAGDDRCPPKTWKGYTYNDGKHVCLPNDNLRSCIMRGAAKVELKGKESFKKLSQSGILFDELYIDLFVDGKQIPFPPIQDIQGPFRDHAEAVKKMGFKLLVKRAVVGQSKHIRVRPMFENWQAVGSFLVVEEQITDEVLNTIWEKSGLQVGLCDWRPGAPRSPGPYGRFATELVAA